MKKEFKPYDKAQLPKYSTCKMFKTLIWGYLKHKVKLNIDNQAGELPSQYVIMCNHPSALDNFYCVVATWPKMTCFVANRYYTFDKTVGKLLKSVGGIPKSLFTADMESVKNTLAMKRDGAILGFMPEVRLSLYGEFEALPESTGRFFKKLDLPVYLCHFDGSYLIKPKWSKKMRKGTIDVTIKLLFDRQRLADLQPDKLQEEMQNALYYNDFQWLDKHPDYRYKCKKQAEGLHNILYKCPHCSKSFCLDTKNDKLFCKECGYAVRVDDRYSFVDQENFPHYFDNFQQWFKSQKEQVIKAVQREDFSLSDEVDLYVQSKTGKGFVEKVGHGVATLDKTGFRFVGAKDNKSGKKEIFVPLHESFYLCYASGKGFQTFFDKEYFMFVPKIPSQSIPWYLASEQLSVLFSQNKTSHKNQQ